MTAHDYFVQSQFDSVKGTATTRGINVQFDGAEDGEHDAFNPVELLLTSVTACLIKGTVRAARMNNIDIRHTEVRIQGKRQDAPPKVVEISYEVLLDTDASRQQLDLIQKNLNKFGTITNTVAASVPVTGYVRRVSNPRHRAAG